MKLFISTHWNGRPAGETTDCFDAMSAHLAAAFKRIGVRYELIPLQATPDCDGWTLYVGYSVKVKYILSRSVVKGKPTAWLCENFSHLAKRSFYFTNPTEHGVYISAPYEPKMYELRPKKNIVLIDHPYHHYDHTQDVLNWADSLPANYQVVMMQPTKMRNVRKRVLIPKRIAVLPYFPLKRYLQATDEVKFFVNTHHETYGYGTIDMLVRGTKVLAVKGGGNRHLNSTFEIPVFNSKDEFLNLIENFSEDWRDIACHSQSRCTTYTRVAEIIANNLQLPLAGSQP